MKDEKLIQFIRNEITSKDDFREVLDWIESSGENQKKYNGLKNLWVITGLEQQKAEVEKKFFAAKRNSKTVAISLQQVLKYAAIILLAFISGALGLYFLNHEQSDRFADLYNEIQVPNGEKSMITLYDGTKVWLNSGTSFRYPVVFKKGTRDVFVSGEAFLDVAKNQKQPFVVHAGQIDVKVLGTRFNVYSYPDDEMLYTTLEEGHVEVLINGSEKKVNLNPGQQFSFSSDANKVKVMEVNTEIFTSWKDDLLRFENAELSEVLKKMERWYGVKFVVDKEFNTSEKFTISIKTESLREMLRVLSFSTGMKYEINDDIVKIKKP